MCISTFIATFIVFIFLVLLKSFLYIFSITGMVSCTLSAIDFGKSHSNRRWEVPATYVASWNRRVDIFTIDKSGASKLFTVHNWRAPHKFCSTISHCINHTKNALYHSLPKNNSKVGLQCCTSILSKYDYLVLFIPFTTILFTTTTLPLASKIVWC